LEEAREDYDRRWKDITGGDTEAVAGLGFEDVPWPIVPPQLKGRKGKSKLVEVTVGDLTETAISEFLLPHMPNQGDQQEKSEVEWKERKGRLREAMLRFHPDKFDGRLMRRVKEGERESVRDGVGQVARVLNALMVKENNSR
jgi:hypothetical protein